MKSPTTTTQAGLYVLGAVVGLYLLGYALIYADGMNSNGGFITRLPTPILDALVFIYTPLGLLLRHLGVI